MEDRVNLPPRGDVEVECHVGDSLLYFEGTCSFHLEFLRSVHVEVGGLEPDLVSYSTGSELGGYSFLHLSLGYLVRLGPHPMLRISLRVGFPGWVGTFCQGEGKLGVCSPL